MNKAFVFGWFALLALMTGYELYAVIWGHKYDPTLTVVLVRDVPWWVTMPFLTWLWIHFFIRYLYAKALLN